MDMVYFSPVLWDSYTQRPHEFVKYMAESTAIRRILWVNPFATRLPKWNDIFHRPSLTNSRSKTDFPAVSVLDVPSVPVEPLPLFRYANDLIWKNVKQEIREFCSSQDDLVIACGKPSRLALWALENLQARTTIYDRMDDFSQFYTSFSKAAMQSWENQIVKQVQHVVVSAKHLASHISHLNSDITVIENGYDMSSLPVPKQPVKDTSQAALVLGYVGSIAEWFDWDLTIALARANPDCLIRLIGPCFVTPPPLPANIELCPALPREELVEQIKLFSVGIIPFKKNELSQGVDPIKFYEYRGLGKPVLSTQFGTMPEHARQGGILFFEETDLNQCVEQSLQMVPTTIEIESFRKTSDWSTRFSTIQSWVA
ncbi:glycosyltransferase family protein [Gimesia algae]|uniref:Teichuronic acid biosynthesis glycosyltransferase TuaH n=1 Tax=Gimesia algae TaxID=2527971 RepID=A0A517VJ59_9PLAN|nr:glycosyltransferase family 1 protein [Gimesia algae]QDT93027.1 Putative teichuronic acid biosynthesis glycosyltransferase TuaH [Gimesia algae]